MGGDIITKTLNEAFGYDGWCLEVKNTTREESTKDDQGRHHVAYIATVRITHHRSGVFRGAIRDSISISISFLSLAHNDDHTRILSSAYPKRTAERAMRSIGVLHPRPEMP